MAAEQQSSLWGRGSRARHAGRAEPARWARHGFLVLVLIALLIGFARRTLVGWNAPLWFDETYTATIAMQPTFQGLISDSLKELSGPVYYALIWVWAKIAGIGDNALRIPSLIFALSTPVVIFFWGAEDRRTRWTWAALAALWMPGFYFAYEARAYAFIFFAGTLQLLAFARLLREPSTARALVWTSLSATLTLTHYYALIVAGFQGLTYLARHRAVAIKTWPAALVFVPVGAWMSVHLPHLLRFADPKVAWQPVLTATDLKRLPIDLLGLGNAAILLSVVIVATLVFDIYRAASGRAPFRYRAEDTLAVVPSLLSIAALVITGMFRSSFTFRYITPAAPGLTLAVALWAQAWGKRWPWLPWLLISLYSVQSLRQLHFYRTHPMADPRWNFNWEVASKYFVSKGVKRMIFLVDSSTTAASDPELVARAGGFFYRRAGLPIVVEPIMLNSRLDDPDPNLVLLPAANRPDDAIMWIYIRGMKRTLALVHPPRITAIDPRWTCHDFGGDMVTVLGCVRQR